MLIRWSFPDALVGGGAMALLSPLFPRSPVNVAPSLKILPPDQSVPGMPGWRWLHTPGHAPGHISLWRESDRTLIAGDAIVTTGQESVYEVIVQKPEMHGPPRYLTPDWEEAERSVAKLAALEPELIITGHGRPVCGANMRSRLHELADNFVSIAVPEGRCYALDPARPGKSSNDAYR
jgi:glyoxylase-like metal-dependent hydrolase (beta-lactamase superfamily II)